MIGIVDSNQKIIGNGLRLHLDASQLRSYPGSGTSWNDLSGNGYNFTLVNSPTFGNHKGVSCFTFSGANDYAWRSGTISHDFGTACTLQIVMSSISDTVFGSCSRLFSINNGVNDNVDYADYFCLASCDQSRFGLWYRNNPGNFYSTSTLRTSNDDYKIITIKWTASSNVFYFVNGSQENSVGIGGSFNYLNVQRISLGINSALNQENSYVRIASVMMYDRELSSTEVTNNYNAIRTRFSL